MSTMLANTLISLAGLLLLPLANAASVPAILPVDPAQTKVADAHSDSRFISTHGISIIRNSSLPCASLRTHGQPGYSYHPLSDADKLAIFESQGGCFMKEYMAVTEQRARETFPSLLEKNFKFKDHKKTKQNWQPTKAAIKHMLDKEAALRGKQAVFGNITNKLSSKENGVNKEKKDNRDNRDNSDFVFVRPKDVGLAERVIDDETGEISQLEMCLLRGTRTYDTKHLYMCTSCTATTTLGDDYWPNFVNEVKCIVEDPNCFFSNSIPHGVCQQSIAPMAVLKKKDDYCSLALKDGETVIVDEWTVSERVVRIACGCCINALSQFADNVGYYSP